MTYGIIDLQVSLRCAWDSQSSFYNSWRTVTEIIALSKYSTMFKSMVRVWSCILYASYSSEYWFCYSAYNGIVWDNQLCHMRTISDKDHRIWDEFGENVQNAKIAGKVFIRCQKSLSSIPFAIPWEKF